MARTLSKSTPIRWRAIPPRRRRLRRDTRIIHWHGVPGVGERILAQVGRRIRRRICGFVHALRAIRRPVPLHLFRQSLARPSRVRARFRVARIHGPVRRRGIASNIDRYAHALPAGPRTPGVRSAALFSTPSRPPPKCAVLIAAILEKLAKLAVRDLVSVDDELRHIDGVSLELVVPTE